MFDPIDEPEGREAETEMVRRFLKRKLNCVITGPPGVGKSTLLRYASQIASALDARYQPTYLDCTRLNETELFIQLAGMTTYQGAKTQLVCIDNLDAVLKINPIKFRSVLTQLSQDNSVMFIATREMSTLPRSLLASFQTVYLGSLSKPSVMKIIRDRLDGYNRKVDTEELALISAGHPLVLKHLLGAIIRDQNVSTATSSLQKLINSTVPEADLDRFKYVGQWALKSGKMNNEVVQLLERSE